MSDLTSSYSLKSLKVFNFPKIKFTFLNVFDFRVNWKLLSVTSFLIVIFCCAFYAWQINYLIRGYFLGKNYNYEISKLLSEKEKLESIFVENNILVKIQNKVEELNFQKVNMVKYIQVPDSYLVKSK